MEWVDCFIFGFFFYFIGEIIVFFLFGYELVRRVGGIGRSFFINIFKRVDVVILWGKVEILEEAGWKLGRIFFL